MRLRPVGVIFPTVANKGSQFGSSIGNRKGLADPRQTKGGKGGNLLVRQFEPFISDRSEFKDP